ncbi:hypothetical protein [Deinococcus sonorensis]|uniref:Uncharacterized protein n=2 Tax=Deinococcus sonorensis TaxID=309891 RepID=A0AAU7UAU6_9DEIO
MTPERDDENQALIGEVVDEGAPPDLLADMVSDDQSRRHQDADDQKNVNDQPSFDDGRLVSYDFEGDRPGDPNGATGSDLGGEEEGGEGAERSGGFDGGPKRDRPLPR